MKKTVKDNDYAKERALVGKRASTLGIICNLLLFSAKIAIGVFSGAVSIVADAVNNLSDVSSALVSFLGFKMAEKPADAEHPYGHARSEYISGIVIATTILFIGFELAKASVEKIISPTPIKYSTVMMVVLVLSILAKAWLSIYNRKKGKEIESATLMATSLDSRNDVLATSAVLLSALIGKFTAWNVDGFVGFAVAIFVMYSGVQLMKETIDPLLGHGVNPKMREEIISTVKNHPKILGCHDLLVHDYGPKQSFASIHIEMDRKEDVLECHEIIDSIEREILEKLGVHLVVHFDPVITGDEEIEHMRSCVQEILLSFNEELRMHDFRMVKEESRTKIVFDVVLPDSLRNKKRKIQELLDAEIEKREKEKYYFFITFDPPELKENKNQQ